MKMMIRSLICLLCYTVAPGFGQNAPLSIAGKVVSFDSTVMVPIYAVDFTDISSCNLKLVYDPEVAMITSVTIGPGLVGMISTNLSIPGLVVLGWFTSSGINLPDSSVIFYMNVTRISHGYTDIHWLDDGYSCNYSDGSFTMLNDNPTEEFYTDGLLVFQSPDAPVTTLPQLAAIPGSEISFPVLVSDFQMIGSFSLQLEYDPQVLTFNSFSNNSGFPGLQVEEPLVGTIIVSAEILEDEQAISLDENATLFSLEFTYQGGDAVLSWVDNGSSCVYRGSTPVYPLLNDEPQSVFYQNGGITSNALPLGAGSIIGPSAVCAGSAGIEYTVPLIDYASEYIWSVPEGAIIVSGINTPTIHVDFSQFPSTGAISVYGSNSFGIGESSYLEVSVIDSPPQPVLC